MKKTKYISIKHNGKDIFFPVDVDESKIDELTKNKNKSIKELK